MKACVADNNAWESLSRKWELYYVLYGRYTAGNDQWLREIEGKYMRKKGLKYLLPKPNKGYDKKKEQEGCIYKILKNTWHEMITVPLNFTSMKFHGAHVCAESKK